MGIFGPHFMYLVSKRRIVDPWLDGGRHMLESLQAVEGSVGLEANDLHMRQLLTQISSCADQCAGCAESSYKVSHALISLAQDLRSRGSVMRLPVGVVVVLVSVPVNVGLFGSQLTRRQDRAV